MENMKLNNNLECPMLGLGTFIGAGRGFSPSGHCRP